MTKTATANAYTADANVNMRSSMTTSAPILKTIPKGATVTYISTHGASGSWLKVTYGGKTGYVAQRYFSPVEGGTVSNQSSTTHTMKLSTTMHSSMSTSSKVLLTIPKGAQIKFLSAHGATGSWAKITYGSKTGYVAKRNVQFPVTVEPKTMYVKTKSSIYSSMSTSSKTLGTLSVTTSVKLLSTHGATGSWAKVAVGSLTGFVPMRNLSESQIAAPVTPYYAQQATTMFSSTSTSSKVLQTIPTGAKVDQLSAHGATGSWFKVRYANVTGYVASRNFSLTPPPTSTEQYGPEREVRIVVDNNIPLNVREKADVSSNKVGELPNGTIVKVKPVLNSVWGILTSGSFAGSYIHLSYTATVTTPPPATGIKRIVSYTSYPITVQAMAERQMAQFGQTDAHRYAKAYLPRAWVKIDGSTGTIINNNIRVISSVGTALKSSASTTSTTLATVPNGTLLQYVSRQTVGSTVWYRVKHGTMTGFVTPSSVVGEAKILERASLTSHAYGQINPDEKVTITGQEGNYYTVSYRRPSGHNIRVFDNTWRRASVSDIEPYVNPSNFSQDSQAFYQFLDLSKSAGTSASTLNGVLQDSGTLTGQGQAFINAANQYNVNEIYLLAHAIHETGHGKSILARGVPVDKDGNALINSSGVRIHPDRKVAATVYNMYGIQAVDSSPLTTGAKFAFEQKWFTPESAIVGGAYWIGASYINHPTHKQNTLYKMRFNPAVPGNHQYATDIGWATKQTTRIFEIYQNLDAYTLHFDVPKFQ